MLKVVSVEKMRQIEAAADASGLTYDQMMQNAGRAVASRVLRVIGGQPDARVTVLVGPGNNGGDGLVAGRIIAQEGHAAVRFYLLREREETDTNFAAVRDAGLFIALAQNDRDFRVLRNMVASADVVVDALFGIGVSLPFKPEAAKVLRQVRQALNDTAMLEQNTEAVIVPCVPVRVQRTRPYVIAVDCPSGLNSDTGDIDANAVQADETVTFIAAKPGLFEFPGAAFVGQLVGATIGVSPSVAELESESSLLVDGELVRELLPTRPINSNKGTFGKTLVIAGSMNYTGAAGLAAMAAYRSGTGLVTVGTPQPIAATLASRFLEPTWLLLPHDMGVLSDNAAIVIAEEVGNYDSLLLGPGWGREQTTREFLVSLLKTTAESSKRRSRRPMGFIGYDQQASPEEEMAGAKLPPLIIDADGLNLLSEIDEWWTLLPPQTILTPHPGEMGRLAKLDTQAVLKNRWQIAADQAAQWNVILVLKGAHTLVAAPDGRVAVLPFKTDALATAGTGDVLAGTIAGLLSQGMLPFDAAVAGSYVHGLAGVLAGQQGSRSVIAGDVLNALPAAFQQIEGANF